MSYIQLRCSNTGKPLSHKHLIRSDATQLHKLSMSETIAWKRGIDPRGVYVVEFETLSSKHSINKWELQC